jgi:hypothetical protein
MSISRYLNEDRRSIRWPVATPRRAGALSPFSCVTLSSRITSDTLVNRSLAKARIVASKCSTYFLTTPKSTHLSTIFRALTDLSMGLAVCGGRELGIAFEESGKIVDIVESAFARDFEHGKLRAFKKVLCLSHSGTDYVPQWRLARSLFYEMAQIVLADVESVGQVVERDLTLFFPYYVQCLVDTSVLYIAG